MELMQKEWYIQAPWGRIALIAWGDCWNPPVLLCHGKVDSAISFKPLVQLLSRNFYYIGLDLPGNGKSDPFPPGLMISAYDIIYAIRVVVLHFRWRQFVYMSHSLGALLGKLYNLCYPDVISKVIDIDPTAAYRSTTSEEFSQWYHAHFTSYFQKYHKFTSPSEFAPKYPYEKAFKMLKKNRALPDEAVHAILERLTQDAGDGVVRFTFDQRFKIINHPPFPPAQIKQLYCNMVTPTLSILAEDSIRKGLYEKTPIVMNESDYPNKNYRYRRFEGIHDLHIITPELIAPCITDFMLYGLEGLDRKRIAKL